jgi:hypothetical protein
MRSTSRAALLAASLGLLTLCSVPALAQDGPASTAAPSPAPAPSPGSSPAGPADPNAPPAASAAPVVPATGYGWSTTPKKHGPWHRTARPSRPLTNKPDAILPGFETLADGTTRLFVQLTRPVTYEQKAAKGSLTYVLKGAYVDKRNNFNPLVTVHFNTPVTSARLVPHGPDLWFVVDLRAPVTPTVALDATKEGGSMLRIDFPKGDYLPSVDLPSPPPSPPPGPAAPPPPAPPPAH